MYNYDVTGLILLFGMGMSRLKIIVGIQSTVFE
jgi:hypothetical protein